MTLSFVWDENLNIAVWEGRGRFGRVEGTRIFSWAPSGEPSYHGTPTTLLMPRSNLAKSCAHPHRWLRTHSKKRKDSLRSHSASGPTRVEGLPLRNPIRSMGLIPSTLCHGDFCTSENLTRAPMQARSLPLPLLLFPHSRSPPLGIFQVSPLGADAIICNGELFATRSGQFCAPHYPSSAPRRIWGDIRAPLECPPDCD